MKVLHLEGLPVDTGGVLSVLRNLQEASEALDLGLTHAVWVNSRYVETRTPALDYRYSRWALGEGPIDARMLACILPSFVAVRNLLKAEHFDIVHAHARGTLPVAVLVARLLHRPVVFTNHSYASHRDLYRRAADHPGVHTVVLSADMADHYGIRTDAPRVHVIPACCSDRYFDEPLVERRQGFSPDDPLRLTGVGMVVPWKGWSTAVEAIALLDPDERASLRFDHWGVETDEDYSAELRALIVEKGVGDVVQMRGSTDRMAEVLHSSDWLLHPAVTDPYPVAVLEALTMGLPVLATSSGGPAEMVTDGVSGAHFEPYDAPGLARLLRAVLRGELPVASPAEVRESARRSAASVVATSYAELYREILDRPR